MRIEKSEPTVKANPGGGALADPGAFMAPGREAAQAGEALAGVGARMTAAQAFQQKSDAVNGARAALNDLTFRAASDPDPKNTDKYIEEIGRIRESSSKGISLSTARREFDSDFGSLHNAALMDLKQDQRRKIVSIGVASIDTGLKQLSQDYLRQDNPIQQRQTIQKMNLLIDQGVAHGFIEADKAVKMKEKNLQDIGVDKFYADLSSIQDANGAAAIMTGLRKGVYEQNGVTIDPEKKKSMLEQAEKYQSKFEKETKAAQEDAYEANNRQSMLDMFDGKLTLSELQRRYTNNELKESDYNTLERKLVSPDYEALRKVRYSDAETFNAIREAQLTGSKTPGELDRMVAGANADGKVTNEDAKYLTGVNQSMAPSPKDSQVSAQAQSVRDWATRYIRGGAIDSMLGGKEKKEKVEALVTDFLKRVDLSKAETPEEIQGVARQVMLDNMKRDHPELNRLEDVPHVVVDIGGKVQKLINPTEKTKAKASYKIVKIGGDEAPTKK